MDPEVRLNMELAYDYRILYNKQMKYNQDSLIMNMDPNQVYYGELRYYLAAGEDTRLISELYTDIFADDNFVKEIMEAGGLNCDVQYAREIIGCSASREHDASIEINNFTNERLEDTGMGYNNAILSFSVCYSHQEACEKMLQTIERKVEEKTRNNQELYKEYSFEKLNTSIRQGVNNDYLTRQKNGTDAINTYVNNITRIESNFTPEDKEYYKVVYLSREPSLLETEEEETDAVSVEERQSVAPVRSLIKWVVIAVFAACVCWGGYYCVKYIFDKRIKTAEELHDVYGLRILGKIEGAHEEKNIIDRKLAEWERKTGSPADSVSYIKGMILSLNKKVILFSGKYGEASLDVVKMLCNQNDGFQYMNYVHQDDHALHAAKGSEGIIIVTEMKKTESKEIKRELEVCRIQGIPVLGVVVVE